jgi:hypothetical protein
MVDEVDLCGSIHNQFLAAVLSNRRRYIRGLERRECPSQEGAPMGFRGGMEFKVSAPDRSFGFRVSRSESLTRGPLLAAEWCLGASIERIAPTIPNYAFHVIVRHHYPSLIQWSEAIDCLATARPLFGL